MNRTIHITEKRDQRKRRTRSKIFGTAERPRVSVFRSNRYLHAQLIDDEKGHTLVSASSRGLNAKKGKKTDQAREVGRMLAEAAKKIGLARAVFDKGAYRYHGRVRAVAEALREGGIAI